MYDVGRSGDIIHLNVGGKRFSTSRQTLTWVPDSFFSSLLSGRISTLKDEDGAIFIDRDPALFTPILTFLRTKELHPRDVSVHMLLHEAEFYGITPLVRKLQLCDELDRSSCGSVLFNGYLPPPVYPAKRRNRHSVAGPQLGSGRPVPSERTPVRRSNTMPPNLRHPGGGTRAEERTSGDPGLVRIICGHHNWIAVAYTHFVACHRVKESSGWQQVFTSPRLDWMIDRVALNAKVMGGSLGENDKMVAVACVTEIILWSVCSDGNGNEIGVFSLNVPVEALFFVGNQLIATSHTGKVGVWNAVTKHWQNQDVVPISSYDTAGSLLILGCSNGSICYIDVQKFPLRMKDNDLLVTELYRDPSEDAITALSVYLTPKISSLSPAARPAARPLPDSPRALLRRRQRELGGDRVRNQFWDRSGHRAAPGDAGFGAAALPDLLRASEPRHQDHAVGEAPDLSVHGQQPRSDLDCHALPRDDLHPAGLHAAHLLQGAESGGRGWTGLQRRDRDGAVRREGRPAGLHPESGARHRPPLRPTLVQREAVSLSPAAARHVTVGAWVPRVCEVRSVDGASITAFTVHECEGSSRIGSRQRRYLFSGHGNGSIQMWDLTTAMEISGKVDIRALGGPTEEELLELLDHCDVSLTRTPDNTPRASTCSLLTDTSPWTSLRSWAPAGSAPSASSLCGSLPRHAPSKPAGDFADPAQPAGPACAHPGARLVRHWEELAKGQGSAGPGGDGARSSTRHQPEPQFGRRTQPSMTPATSLSPPGGAGQPPPSSPGPPAAPSPPYTPPCAPAVVEGPDTPAPPSSPKPHMNETSF